MGFIIWHYSRGVRLLLGIWKNYLDFFWWYFGISRHFKTLFSPWKRDISRVERRGLHPIIWLQKALENTVTRFWGAVLKLSVIFAGIFFELLSIIFGFFALVVWLAFPLFLTLGLGFFLSFYSKNYALASIEGTLFIISALLLFASIRTYLKSKLFLARSDFHQLGSQEWFKRVLERIDTDSASYDANVFSQPEEFSKYLRNLDLSSEEFQEIAEWENFQYSKKTERKKFWLRENLFDTIPIGQGWTYAYTVHLDQYATDLSVTDPTEYKTSVLVDRDEEIEMLELILTRPNQNSVLIIGEPGVGKRTLVHALAANIREGKANPYLLGKRILELNLGEIVSGISNQGQIEEVLRNMFFEAAYAGNVILAVDNLGQHMRSEPQNPGDDISGIILEFLAGNNFQLIGLSSPMDFHENIERKEGLMKFFEKIQIEEMNKQQTLQVLLQELDRYENKQVVFTYQALREIVRLSERFLTDAPFPEKSLDLMEETFLYWTQEASGNLRISPGDVAEVVSKKIKMPVGELQNQEKEKLINLEEILHRRVIGQEFAIKQIAETMRRARVGMSSSTKPMGSFLFLGPTGVGKTESAKTLAEAYFGDEKNMIRLDMSEYQNAESVGRLIGSVEINMTGHLTNKVKENPYSLLLLDEVEKAHPDILNLFLQILDEGSLTDAFGKKINFRNLIIIATSNAGSDVIKEAVESRMDPEIIQQKLIDYVIHENIFRPEFLNRFEGVVFFHPLENDEILKIAALLLEKYARQLREIENIGIQFEQGTDAFVVEKGYDRKFGARSVDRFIQDQIGDRVIKKIISGEIKKGEDFLLRRSDLASP